MYILRSSPAGSDNDARKRAEWMVKNASLLLDDRSPNSLRLALSTQARGAPRLPPLHWPFLPEKAEGNGAGQRRLNINQIYVQYIQQQAFPTLGRVLHHSLLLRETAEHGGRALRLLKKASQPGASGSRCRAGWG